MIVVDEQTSFIAADTHTLEAKSILGATRSEARTNYLAQLMREGKSHAEAERYLERFIEFFDLCPNSPAPVE